MKTDKKWLRFFQLGIIILFALSGGFTPVSRILTDSTTELFLILVFKYIKIYLFIIVLSGVDSLYHNGFTRKGWSGIYRIAMLTSMALISVLLKP